MSLTDAEATQVGVVTRPASRARPGSRPTVGEILALTVLAFLALSAIVPELFTSVDPLAINPAVLSDGHKT